MAAAVREMYNDFDGIMDKYADPRTRSWFLLSDTPVYVWMLTAAYLLFVWLGPKVMKNREPFDLKWLMIIYNMGCVLLSLYMAIEILLAYRIANYSFVCAAYNENSKTDPNHYRMAAVLYWYFFSKAIEFMDTVLMVLRKKNGQITFLHVFHHASMLNIWWWVETFIPGGCAYFGAWLNCVVHVVMYSYYGLSAIPALKGKLWWKKYITRFQLIQFMVTLSHTSCTIGFGCDFPEWGKQLLAGYMVTMLILFSNFYMQAYMKRKHQPKKEHSNGVKLGNGDALHTNGHRNNHKKHN